MRIVAALLVFAATSLAQLKEPMNVMGSIGCLVQEEGQWYLTHATEPVLATEIDQDLDPTASGDLRYHLIGTLDEFGAPKHVEHKVRVKGLIIEAEPEPNLNISSLKHVAPTCP